MFSKHEVVVSFREQCRTQRVPFFFKQWGGVRKSKKGRRLDGRTYDEYPRRATADVPDRVSCLRYAQEFLESLRTGPQEPLVQLTS
jgi:hypothetical protein